MHINRGSRRGFALPTVLIASVVMLTILAASVSSVVAVRNAIKGQYYEQLAKAAGEAGVAYAKACLAKNGNVPLWSNAKPLTPATDCAGNSILTNNLFRSLVVAGGGSGGGSTGGGGGAGGVVSTSDFPLANGTYSVVVGAGGAAAGNQLIGKNGGNSSFNGVTAIGGGGGGHTSSSCAAVTSGLVGGSGGGAQTYCAGTSPGGGTAGQGTSGGNYSVDNDGTTGGGGAGGTGLSTTTTYGGGAGGPGKLSTITGAAIWYGGGGGGGDGTGTPSAGGIGGGGSGGNIGTAGQPNTGGGGGGGWSYATGNSGAGGSGVVVISYPNNGTVASGGDETYVTGAYKVHIFRTTGTSGFTVSSVASASCPSDPRCSVMVGENMRSSFSVGMPTVDSQGKATAIPNSGYVELLRESNGAIWRTYKQPSVQAAVVPDLCSGSATTGLGWQNAVATSTQISLPDAPSATTISLANSALPAGQLYFRRDFAVTATGLYKVSTLTASILDKAEIYIDGNYVASSQGSLGAANVSLSAGCHTATVRLTNKTLQPKAVQFAAAVSIPSSTAPIMTTDPEWRVSVGAPVSFSSVDYYADPEVWRNSVTLYGNGTGLARTSVSTWPATTGDAYTPMITPSNNGCSLTCPASATAYLRDSRDFYLASPTELTVSSLCDDSCSIYIDGQIVTVNQTWPVVVEQTFTLAEGYHHMGILLNNGAGSPNPSGVAATLVNRSTGSVVTRTDLSWITTDTWVTNVGNVTAYEASFTPSPKEIVDYPSFDIFIVGGGGGGGKGGGGGGGGVVYKKGLTLSTGAHSIVIGGGGAGGSSGNGTNGSSTTFSGPGIGTITANGGGGGGGISTVALPGSNGASGGGGGMSVSGTDSAAGGSGITGQGASGGASAAASCSPAGGGGGAGGPGAPASASVPGVGGAGVGTSITGAVVVYGSGGGGGSWCLGGSSGAENAGSGSTTTGTAGVVNSGGGGGGGGANGGSGGGAGGSGFVALRFKEGQVTVSASGTNGVTYATNTTVIAGQRYTVYRFFANSTFTISGYTPN